MRVLRKYLFVVIVLIAKLYSQNDTINFNKDFVKRNNISAELGGTGFQYSFGYEFNFTRKKFYNESIRILASYNNIVNFNRIFVPLEYSLYVGKRKRKILFGAGIIGIFGTSPFPSGFAAQQDYRKLYINNGYNAIKKYGNGAFQSVFDLAYTARLGYKYVVNTKIDLSWYINCFYLRMPYEYYFQHFWFGMGLTYKLH